MKEKCNCEEMTCKIPCDRNHTHKEFWCEKCHPERYVVEEKVDPIIPKEEIQPLDLQLAIDPQNACMQLIRKVNEIITKLKK